MPSSSSASSEAAGLRAPVAAAFVLSGAAGLVYQVAWQRILALHSGVGIYSVALIVAAFMAGLGLGSHLGGVLSARLGARRALLAFGLVEVAIGLFGALSAPIYYDWLYPRAAPLYAGPLRAGALHFIALAAPTTLMGMSLPLLVRASVADAATAGRTIGILYGLNLAGACLGALLTPWVLVRLLGIRGALGVAAAANVLVGLVALIAPGGGAPKHAPATDEAVPAGVPATIEGRRATFALCAALYGLSGFMALSLEIVWFRIVEVAVKATAFAFGTVLALYLGGLAAGTLVASSRVHRLRDPLKTFLLCEALLLTYSALAVGALAALPIDAPVYAWFYEFWGGGLGPILGESGDRATTLRLYLLLPMALFGLPTFLMGFAFPALQRAVQDDPATSGRKVGVLQAANIAGCVAGTLLVGLGALRWVGTTGTIRALALPGLVFCIVGVARVARPSTFVAAAVGLVAAAVAMPGGATLWRRLHGTTSSAALVEEDATGVAAIIPQPTGPWRVFVSGRHHSWVPFGGAHTRLGAAPAVIHPAPTDVAIIGLGSGDTAWAAGCRPETRTLTVFEISGPQPRLLRRLAAASDQPLLAAFLRDPRLRLVEADGRLAIGQGKARYDVIEADALWPEAAYSGNLYSVEFFRECAARLKPGGVMCTWAPTPRAFASFVQAFRHVVGVPSRDILFGSNQPLEEDPAVWRERLQTPEVTRYLGRDTAEEVGRLLDKLVPLGRRPGRGALVEANHDLFPRDEFLSP